MKIPSENIGSLATQLLALEAANHHDNGGSEAARVVDRLRISLVRFAGNDGFAALLRRSIVLVQTDDAALQAVKFTDEGKIEGFENIKAESGAPVITHLLWLLATFIGEQMTFQIVREIWPEAVTAFDD